MWLHSSGPMEGISGLWLMSCRLCMAIIAGGSSQPNNSGAIAAAAAFIFMFSFFFPTGFLGLTFLYAAEIAPLSHRSSITAISTGSAWLFNFVSASRQMKPFALYTESLLTMKDRWSRKLHPLASRQLGTGIPLSTRASICFLYFLVSMTLVSVPDLLQADKVTRRLLSVSRDQRPTPRRSGYDLHS